MTVDNRAEKIGYKIREARMDKLPYMLVVGADEEADGTVSVRSRFEGNEGVKPLSDFIDQICKETVQRKSEWSFRKRKNTDN